MATIKEIVDNALENYHKVFIGEGNTVEKQKAYWDEVASELLRTPVTDYMQDTYALGVLSNKLSYTSGAAAACKETKKLRLSMLVDWFHEQKKLALEHGYKKTVGMGRAAQDINHVVRDAGSEARNLVGGDQYNQILDMALQGYLDLGYLHNLKQDAYDRLVNNSKDPEQPPIPAQIVSDFFDNYSKKVDHRSADPLTPEKLNDLKSVLLKMEDRAPDYGANYDDLYAAQRLFQSFPDLPKDSAETRTALSRLIVEAGQDFPFRTLRILTKFRPDDVFDYLADPKKISKQDHHIIGALQNTVPNEKLKDLLTTHLQNVSPDSAKHIGDLSRQFLASMNNPITIDDKMVRLAKDIFEKHNIDVLGAGNFVSGKEGRDWESFRNDKLISSYLKNPTDENFMALGKGLSKRFGTAIEPSSLSAIADSVLENASAQGAMGATSYIQAINTVDNRFAPTLLNKLLDKNHTHYTNSQKGLQTITPERKANMGLMLSSMVGSHFGHEGINSKLPTETDSIFHGKDFDGKSAASSDTDYEDSLRDLVGHLKATADSKTDVADYPYILLHQRLVNHLGHDLAHTYAAAAGKLVMPNDNQAHEVDPQYGNSIGVMQVQPQTSGLRAIRTMLNDRGALSVKDVSAKLNPFRRVEQNETMVPDWDQFVDSDGNISIDKLEAHKERIAGTPQARSAIPKIDKVIQHIKSVPKLDPQKENKIREDLVILKEAQAGRGIASGLDEDGMKRVLSKIKELEATIGPHKVERLPADLRNGFPVKKKVVTENKLIDWSPLSVGGNIHPDKLEEAITKSPIVNVGFHTGRFVLGLQQHNGREEQNVLTLDVTPEQIKKLKDEGLFEDYTLMASDLPTGLHPQNRYGLGWIRWNEHSENPTDPKQPLHIHIDEVQSDWDDRFKEHIESHGEQDAPKVKRIREILFHGHEPGELIHETFQQHIRNNHDVENKPVVWAVWDKDSKKKMRICGLDTSRLPPVDWHMNYQEHPIAMGGKKAKYSNYAYVLPKGTTKVTGPDGAPFIMLPDDYQGNPNIKTSQTNTGLQGEPTYEGLVHKMEEFVQFLDKLQKEEVAPQANADTYLIQMYDDLTDRTGRLKLQKLPVDSPEAQEQIQKLQKLIDEVPHIKSSDVDAGADTLHSILDELATKRTLFNQILGEDRNKSLRESLAVSTLKYILNHPDSHKTGVPYAMQYAYNNVGDKWFEEEPLMDKFFRRLVRGSHRDIVLGKDSVMALLYNRKLVEMAEEPSEPPIPLDAVKPLANFYRASYLNRDSENGRQYLTDLKKVMARTAPSYSPADTSLNLLKEAVEAPERLKELKGMLESGGKEMTPDVVRNFLAATSRKIEMEMDQGGNHIQNVLATHFPEEFPQALMTSELAPPEPAKILMNVYDRKNDRILPLIPKLVEMEGLNPAERNLMVKNVGELVSRHLDIGVDLQTARFLLDHYKKTGEDVIDNGELTDSDMMKEYFNFKKDKLLKEFEENPNQSTAKRLADIKIPDWHMTEKQSDAAKDSITKRTEDALVKWHKSAGDSDEFNKVLQTEFLPSIKHALFNRAILDKDHDLFDRVSGYASDKYSAQRMFQQSPYQNEKSLYDQNLEDHIEQFMNEKKEREPALPPPVGGVFTAKDVEAYEKLKRHRHSMKTLAIYLSGKGRLITPDSNRAHKVLPEFEAGIKEMDVQPQSSGLRAIRTKLKEMGGKLLSIKDVSAKLNPFRRVEEKESMVDDWTPFENEDGTLSVEKLRNYREYVATTPQARSVVPKMDKLIEHIQSVPMVLDIDGPRIKPAIKVFDLPPQLKSSPVKKKVVNTSTVVDWNPISHSGNIHAQKLEDAIGQSPAFKVGYHLGKFTLGMQQHMRGPQEVMTLDVTPEQIKRIKEEGLWEPYQLMAAKLPTDMHPQNKHGLGWVRWTQEGDAKPDSPAPVHMHLDEVQSDWDDAPVRIAAGYGYEPIRPDKYHSFHKMTDDQKTEASAKTKKLIEDYKELRKILFHGMEPAQLIHEALQQHVRNTFDVEKKPILWSTWSKKSKKKMEISGLDITRDPPVDWNVAYNQHPFAMGGEEEQYSQHANRVRPDVPAFTPTSQKNPDLQGEPTIGGKVHKSEGLDREEIKLGVKTEMEHTKNPKEALKIALDHLNEDPRYYSKAKECGLIKFDMFLR